MVEGYPIRPLLQELGDTVAARDVGADMHPLCKASSGKDPGLLCLRQGNDAQSTLICIEDTELLWERWDGLLKALDLTSHRHILSYPNMCLALALHVCMQLNIVLSI